MKRLVLLVSWLSTGGGARRVVDPFFCGGDDRCPCLNQTEAGVFAAVSVQQLLFNSRLRAWDVLPTVWTVRTAHATAQVKPTRCHLGGTVTSPFVPNRGVSLIPPSVLSIPISTESTIKLHYSYATCGYTDTFTAHQQRANLFDQEVAVGFRGESVWILGRFPRRGRGDP